MKNGNIQNRVTAQQLGILLKAHKGAAPITIEALTDVKMNKRNNPYFDRVQKHQVLNGFMNFNYENAVNRAQAKEGNEPNFVAKATWGSHETLGVIEHHGTEYLQIRPKKSLSVNYLCDGLPINKEEIADFLPNKGTSSRQNVSEGNEVQVRRFKLSNLISVTFNGNQYIVI